MVSKTNENLNDVGDIEKMIQQYNNPQNRNCDAQYKRNQGSVVRMSSNNNPQGSIPSSSASTLSNMLPFISNVAVSAKPLSLTPVSKGRKRPDYTQMMLDRTFIYLSEPF